MNDIDMTFQRVMSDERRYDQIQGPDRNALRLEQTLQVAADKGRELKVQHIKQNYGYSSFEVEPPKVQPIKFDQTLSREAANKPFIKEPQGAPFWKYNVKDDIISVPIKSHKISSNPIHSHHGQIIVSLPETIKNPPCGDDFTCGRIKKRLQRLKDKYVDLAEYNDQERYEQAQADMLNSRSMDLESETKNE